VTDYQSVVLNRAASVLRTVNPLFALTAPKSLSSSCQNLARTCLRTCQNFSGALKLADAPDLGFRNRRFQTVPFRFKKRSVYEGKAQFFAVIVAFTSGE
jgi:hypothetical protein